MNLHWVGEHFPEAKRRTYMGGAIGQKNENTSTGGSGGWSGESGVGLGGPNLAPGIDGPVR